MEPQWERLAEQVSARRSSRGWSQAAVRRRGGPSDTLQSTIERGQWRPTRGVDDTLQKIDSGLQWQPGSASSVLAGGEPTPIPDPRDDRHLHAAPEPGPGPIADTPDVADDDDDDDRRPITRVDLGYSMDYAQAVVDLLVRLSGAEMDAHTRSLLTRTQAQTIAYLYSLVPNASDVDAAVKSAVAVARQLGTEEPLFLNSFELAINTIAKLSTAHTVAITGAHVVDGADDQYGSAIDVPIPGGHGHVVLRITGDGDTVMTMHDTPPPPLADAARTAPPGYRKGRPQQGEAGEEQQDN